MKSAAVFLLVWALKLSMGASIEPMKYWTLVPGGQFQPGSRVEISVETSESMMKSFERRETKENEISLGAKVTAEAAVGAYSASMEITSNYRNFHSTEETEQTKEEKSITNKMTTEFTVPQGKVGVMLVEMNLYVVKDEDDKIRSFSLPSDSSYSPIIGSVSKQDLQFKTLDSSCQRLAAMLGLGSYTKDQLVGLYQRSHRQIPTIRPKALDSFDTSKTYLIALADNNNMMLSKYWGGKYVSCRPLTYTKWYKYKKYWLWRFEQKPGDKSQYRIINNSWGSFSLADHVGQGMTTKKNHYEYYNLEKLGDGTVRIKNAQTNRFLKANHNGCGFDNTYGSDGLKLVETTESDIDNCAKRSKYIWVKNYCHNKFSDFAPLKN